MTTPSQPSAAAMRAAASLTEKPDCTIAEQREHWARIIDRYTHLKELEAVADRVGAVLIHHNATCAEPCEPCYEADQLEAALSALNKAREGNK